MNTRAIPATLVLVGAVCFAVYTLVGKDWAKHRKRRDLADELAAFIAAQCADIPKGKVYILAPEEQSTDVFPKQLAKRTPAHLQRAGFTPAVVSTVPFNEMIENTGEPVDRATFLGLLRQQPDAALVVSLVGIPRLTDADLPATNRPRIVVASSVIMPHLATMPKGIVDFAVMVKQGLDDPRSDPALGELSNYFVLQRLRE